MIVDKIREYFLQAFTHFEVRREKERAQRKLATCQITKYTMCSVDSVCNAFNVI